MRKAAAGELLGVLPGWELPGMAPSHPAPAVRCEPGVLGLHWGLLCVLLWTLSIAEGGGDAPLLGSRPAQRFWDTIPARGGFTNGVRTQGGLCQLGQGSSLVAAGTTSSPF